MLDPPCTGGGRDARPGGLFNMIVDGYFNVEIKQTRDLSITILDVYLSTLR